MTMQHVIFFGLTGLIAFLTFLKCHAAPKSTDHSTEAANKEVFLAGGGLSWFFVAGSITLTNLSTDQLVGMNGNQMALLAWWELAAVAGLLILAKVFLPVYYKYNCTTTTELLEKRYNDHHIRALIAVLFLLGNIFIFIPSMLYTGSLFMKSMFGVDAPIIFIAVAFAAVGSAYAVFGGLRAVAVSDAYSGVLLFSLGVLVVFLAMKAIDFDFSGIPAERLTMIGGNDSPIPWHTLLTGMIFIQVFYWSTNQTITQRAMASPTVEEGQKGVFVAAGIRFLIVPPMIVVPGIVSYKLYGDIGDAAYGRIVSDVLPAYLSGAFAAAIAAATLTSVNSVLNSSTTLYICDIHEKYVGKAPNVPRLNAIITIVIVYRPRSCAFVCDRREHHQPDPATLRFVKHADLVGIHRRFDVQQCRFARRHHRSGVRRRAIRLLLLCRSDSLHPPDVYYARGLRHHCRHHQQVCPGTSPELRFGSASEDAAKAA